MAVKGHVTSCTHSFIWNRKNFWKLFFYSSFVAIGLNPQNIDHPLTFWGKMKKHPCLNFLEYIFFSSFFKQARMKQLCLALTFIPHKIWKKYIFTARCIIFSLRTDIGKQKITFFATNNYNPVFYHKYK